MVEGSGLSAQAFPFVLEKEGWTGVSLLSAYINQSIHLAYRGLPPEHSGNPDNASEQVDLRFVQTCISI